MRNVARKRASGTGTGIDQQTTGRKETEVVKGREVETYTSTDCEDKPGKRRGESMKTRGSRVDIGGGESITTLADQQSSCRKRQRATPCRRRRHCYRCPPTRSLRPDRAEHPGTDPPPSPASRVQFRSCDDEGGLQYRRGALAEEDRHLRCNRSRAASADFLRSAGRRKCGSCGCCPSACVSPLVEVSAPPLLEVAAAAAERDSSTRQAAAAIARRASWVGVAAVRPRRDSESDAPKEGCGAATRSTRWRAWRGASCAESVAARPLPRARVAV